jgi:hypothetical protein
MMLVPALPGKPLGYHSFKALVRCQRRKVHSSRLHLELSSGGVMLPSAAVVDKMTPIHFDDPNVGSSDTNRV